MTHTLIYTYNGDGVRVAMAEDGQAIAYIVDQIGLAQVLVEITGTERITYAYGLARLWQARGESSTEWFLGDALGSVRQLVDADGHVVLRRDYAPFGQVVSETGTGSTGYAYTGEQVDPITGLVFLRARWLDPITGRFFSVDPFPGYDMRPGTLQSYIYCLNNPANCSDPTGEYGETPWDVAMLVLDVGIFAWDLYYYLELDPDAELWEKGLVWGLDSVALAVDAVSIIVPGLPGGGGAALSLSACGVSVGARTAAQVPGFVRTGQAALKGAQTALQTLKLAQSGSNSPPPRGQPSSQVPGQWGAKRGGPKGAQYERKVRQHLGGPPDQNLYYPDRNGPAYDAWNPNTQAFVDAKDASGTWFTDNLPSELVSRRDDQILDEARRQIEHAGSYGVEWWTHNAKAAQFLTDFFQRNGVPIKVVIWP